MKFPVAVALVACNCSGFSPVATAQVFTFTTAAGFAGNYGTNDGTGSSAQFYFPSGVAVDRTGNLFVSDTSNNTIRKVAPYGAGWTVTTIAGFPAFGADGGTNDGIGGLARFWRPNGVAVFRNGTIFVADHYNHTIRKVVPEGTNWVVSTIAGLAGKSGHADGTNDQARFYSPTGICVDPLGNLFVVDTANFIIRKVALSGTNWVVTTIAGTALNFDFVDGSNGEAAFNYPFGIALDLSSNLYVADYGNNAIRKISPQGSDWVVSTIAGGASMGHADGTNSDATFNAPADIAVDATGILYISDQNNHTIRRIEALGTNWVVSTIAGVALQQGSADGTGSTALFSRPWGIAIDGAGVLYLADQRNGTIRIGIPSSTLPPVLDVALIDRWAVVSWPLSAPGFDLQMGDGVSGTTWSSLTNITIRGSRFVATNKVNPGSLFFRLARSASQ